MIDVHCHLLPGLDDGAKDLDTALILVRQLSQAGFQKVIATPHVLEGREFLDPDTIRKATIRFNLELEREGIPLEVLPGAENYIFPELPQYLKEGKILTLADSHKYLLFELPMQELPSYTEHVIFELQVQGIVPVLAHPERYSYFAEATELLVKWKNQGVLLQVDLRSLEGCYGPGPLDLASWLLENGLVQVVGTDAHRASQREDGYRKALERFFQRVGPEHFERYLKIYPQVILRGEELEILDQERLMIPFHNKRNGLDIKLNWRERIRSFFTISKDKGFQNK
ncbi:MAG: CpsB/CapC family capsule biosynthesis tyrosine phosphatase [Syntrophomonas sp.]